jgi:hypothetical protein
MLYTVEIVSILLVALAIAPALAHLSLGAALGASRA